MPSRRSALSKERTHGFPQMQTYLRAALKQIATRLPVLASTGNAAQRSAAARAGVSFVMRKLVAR